MRANRISRLTVLGRPATNSRHHADIALRMRTAPSQPDADRTNLKLLGRINRPANMTGRTR